MGLVVGNVQEQAILTALLKAENQYLKLFVNDYTPVNGSVAGSFTEMSTHGYAHIELTKTDWTLTSGADGTLAEQPQKTFSFTTGAATTIYGYYLVDKVSGALIYAERFAAAEVITNAADFKITLKINCQ